MSSPSDQPIKIELFVQAGNANFLEGLESLLQLGLISDVQVRRICQAQLVCVLPEPIVHAAASEDFAPAADDFAPASEDFAPPAPAVSRRRDRRRPRPASDRQPSPSQLVPQALNALMAEISVIWLLFLGVFLVVVSSAVLAASQWRNVSPLGQYSILLGYTILFWLAGVWTQRNPNLRVTSRMLQIATLLIIPVNFWMMDGFRLWQTPLGIGIGAIAALLLSFISGRLLRAEPRSLLINHIGLSWLHWGWAFPNIPLIAAYVGTIGTAALLYRWQSQANQPRLVSPGLGAIAFAGLLLIGRAVLSAGVPFSRLGLAIGIAGWLFVWLARQSGPPLWAKIGAALLLLGWFSSVTTDPPWQAVLIGGLGISLLCDRVQRHAKQADVLALFGVGFITFALLWWLLPLEGRSTITTQFGRWSGRSVTAENLAGLRLFPYLVGGVGLAGWLRHRQKPDLARTVEGLTLATGGLLAVAGVENPLVRSLYFSLSAVLLIVVLWRRSPILAGLIYLTHATILAALLGWINFGWPLLSDLAWARIFLAGAIAEWVLYLGLRHSIWQKSSWHLGLVLAAVSYVLFLSVTGLQEAPAILGLIWLLVPVALTGFSLWAGFSQPRLAAWLGVVAVGLAQLLTIPAIEPFLVSSGIGTLLLLGLSWRLPNLLVALLSVGFGLLFATTAGYQIWKQQFDLLLFWAIALVLLWIFQEVLRRRSQPLAQTYTLALSGWAAILAALNLLLLSAAGVIAISDFLDPPTLQKVKRAGLITTLEIATFRIWRKPSNLGFWGTAWGIEVLLLAQAATLKEPLSFLATANVSLGLLTQLLGDGWQLRPQSPAPAATTPAEPAFRFVSWHAIPLVYALLGAILAHTSFTAATSLHTLAVGFTLVGVGRRQSLLKPFTLLGLAVISGAALERLLHWLSQFTGGETGDGLTLIGLLFGAIALLYALTQRWLATFLKLTPLELRWAAHLHWGLGSLLLLWANTSGLSDTGVWLWIGSIIVLAIYAIWQGRQQEGWVYVGFIQLVLAIRFLSDKLFVAQTLLVWGAAIAALFSLAIFYAPWRSWGWSTRPWKISAAVLPGLVVFLTGSETGIQSLLLVAIFYAWLAKTESQIRLSYISVGLANWAIARILWENQLTQPLWYIALACVSLLYVAQIDPWFQHTAQKEQRHWLRSLAIALFCLTALYQAGTDFWQGIAVIGLGIGLVLAGLLLRTRAFLYVGTLTFILKVLHQLWLFINDNSLVLWAMGIVLGLLLIWIAATFESRRSQAIALLQQWVTELEAWE